MAPEFDISALRPRVEPTPRWIRVRAGDEWIADSRRALLLVWYGPGRLPTYCFPEADVRTEVLRPAADGGGDYHVVAGGAVLEAAAHRIESPDPPFAAAAGHWTFTWDGRVTWFEEATEIAVHARDPSKRVDAVPSERHVRVEVEGELVAESRRPLALFETALPTRWYFPPEDVRQELLDPTTTITRCPYKGTASYYSVHTGDVVTEDLAWSYPDPIPECPRIAGLIAFFNERVDLIVDGELQARPHTPWSRSPSGDGPAR
jgi:uncharacterized protein (DUF427 family)